MSYYDQTGPAKHLYADTSQPLLPFLGRGSRSGLNGLGASASGLYAPPGVALTVDDPAALSTIAQYASGEYAQKSNRICVLQPTPGGQPMKDIVQGWVGQGLFVVIANADPFCPGPSMYGVGVDYIKAMAGTPGWSVFALPDLKGSTKANWDAWLGAPPGAMPKTPPGVLPTPPGTTPGSPPATPPGTPPGTPPWTVPGTMPGKTADVVHGDTSTNPVLIVVGFAALVGVVAYFMASQSGSSSGVWSGPREIGEPAPRQLPRGTPREIGGYAAPRQLAANRRRARRAGRRGRRSLGFRVASRPWPHSSTPSSAPCRRRRPPTPRR